MLTLPMLGILKEVWPELKISFLGRNYTQPILDACYHVDQFISWDRLESLAPAEQQRELKGLDADAIVHVFPRKNIARLARGAGIPIRVGTSHRLYHWLTCNRRPSFSRKDSNLHEAQLNLKLLAGLGLNVSKTTTELSSYYGFSPQQQPPEQVKQQLDVYKRHIILHPKSKGSAVEWGVERFISLAGILARQGYQVLFTGTEAEGEQFRNELPPLPEIVDLSGQLSLGQLIGLIAMSDGLVAASTGPLHIAAALGKLAIGLYSPRRPIHPSRWMPIGKNADYLIYDEDCKNCGQGNNCNCIERIEPEKVWEKLNEHI